MLLIGGGWLLAIPAAIHFMENGDLRPQVMENPWLMVAVTTFLAGAMIAIIAGYHLVTYGKGTPFPLDRTRRLVTSGPYRYVRNPQGIAMLLMTLGVVFSFKSTFLWLMVPLTLIYLELIVGPIEEKQLERDYGNEYAEYKNRVRKWIPRKPFDPKHLG